MAQVRTLLPSLIATLVLAAPALQAAGDDPQAQIVEDLRQLAQEARQRNAADRWLQRALDDLVARYDNPWQQPILLEDFGDGDYTYNPTWQVTSGYFQVLRGQGLTSSIGGYGSNTGTQPAPQQPSPEAVLGGMIVGALLESALGPSNQPPSANTTPAPGYPQSAPGYGPNQIRLQANVTNAFSMITTLRTGGTDGARFDISLLQSEQGSYGYRLSVETGVRGFVELQRIRNGRGAVVENQPLSISLDDGRLHDITWQQTPDGTVTVKIDDTDIFQVRDKAFRDGYPWLVLNHASGDLTVRSVQINGV